MSRFFIDGELVFGRCRLSWFIGYIGGRCVLRDGGVYRGARYVDGATGSGQSVMTAAPQDLGSERYDVRWMAIGMVTGVSSVDL